MKVSRAQRHRREGRHVPLQVEQEPQTRPPHQARRDRDLARRNFAAVPVGQTWNRAQAQQCRSQQKQRRKIAGARIGCDYNAAESFLRRRL